MPRPTPAEPARAALEGLTSLRFFAALLVFLVHSSLFLGTPQAGHAALLPHAREYARVVFAGPTGVGFFFLLSGFVLMWSRRPDDTSRSFYRRRWARIAPNHLLTWLLALVFLLVVGAQVRLSGALLSLTLLQAWVPDQHVFGAVNTPSWSLSCELFFYALFPVLAFGLGRLDPRRRPALMAGLVLVPLLVLLAQPTLARNLTTTKQEASFFTYYFPPTRLAEFVIGILLAMQVRDGRWPRIPLRWALGAVVVGLAAVDVTGQSRYHVLVTLLPFVLLIGSVAQLDLSGRQHLLRHPVLVRLGQWSYAFYLVHWTTLAVFAQIDDQPVRNPLAAVAMVLGLLAACLLLSALLFSAWERPLERVLRRRTVAVA